MTASSFLDVVPEVTTARLVLRGWRLDDIDSYAAWLADEDTVRYIGGKTMDRAEAWRSMATMAGHWLLRGYGFWAIADRDTGALIGRVGLWFPEGWPGIEVGWLVGKEHRRRGYAREAAQATIDWARARRHDRTLFPDGLDRVLSVIHKDNAASAAVARSLGEQPLWEQEVRGFPCVVWGVGWDG